VQHAASAITAPDTGQLPAYWQFHEAVTRAQLTEWLPTGRHLLVDISGPRGPGAKLAAKAGHTVLRVLDPGPGRAGGVWGGGQPPQEQGGSRGDRSPRKTEHGNIIRVIADSSRLTFLADGCADGVIADDRALSVYLAAEAMIAEVARVLRPAGRVIACVDSLVLGMAVLADQHHWAQLVDLPHAEVVLVPWPDGRITRCYGPDQARELFAGAGLRVNWIRSRTVFSESLVTHWLRRDPGALPKLVRAELAARSDESLGAQLVISASKPRPAGRTAVEGRQPLPRELASPLSPLGLAADAAGSVRAGVEPALGYGVTAVHALSVAGLVDAGQRGEHPVTLLAGGQQDRLGAVGLGENGSRVARIRRIPRARHGLGPLALQDGDRPVQVVAHLLQALAGDSSLHWCPRLPSACGRQRRLALAPSHVLRGRGLRTTNRAASHRQRKPRPTHRRPRAA
jgi:hypothetical protein